MAQRVKVLKRDGSFEEFNPDKIARVVQAAGLDSTQAALLAGRVAKRVSNSKRESISSLEIRNKVLEELKKVNKNAAGLFEWYEKTKQKKYNKKLTLDRGLEHR